jgi:hypothetical protein
MTPPRLAAVLAGVVASLSLTACSGDGPAPPDDGGDATATTETPTATPTETPTETPTDVSPVCYPAAEEVSIPPEMGNLLFPERTVIFNVDERGDNGVVLTGVTDLLYRAAASQMRKRYSSPPFSILDLDEIEGALGAVWLGPSISGRWQVTDISESCPGDTEVRVLWTSAG